jgi:hypothetical protein
MNTRKPNNRECCYNGYKLSCLADSENIETSEGYVVIGSDIDDTQEDFRVKITLISDDDTDDNIYYVEIDLEDVLRFAAKRCNGIYKRVLAENDRPGESK